VQTHVSKAPVESRDLSRDPAARSAESSVKGTAAALRLSDALQRAPSRSLTDTAAQPASAAGFTLQFIFHSRLPAVLY